MKTIKEFFKDKKTMRWSLYVVLTMFLLYLTLIITRNLGDVLSAIGSGIGAVLTALAPFWIGLALAYLFNPFIEFLERTITRKMVKIFPDTPPEKLAKKTRRRKLLAVLIAYLIVIAIIVAIIYGFVALILGQLVVTSFPKMINSLMDIVTNYQNTIRDWAANMPSGAMSEKVSAFVDKLFGWVANSFNAASVASTVKGVGGTIVNLVIGLIMSIYLSYDKKTMIGLWNKILGRICTSKQAKSVNDTLNDVNTVLSTFLRGVLLDALIVAILSSVGLSIIGLQFAVFIGIFAGICNIIPYFGPILGMIPAFIVGLLTQDVWHGLIAVVVLLIIQQVDGNIIYPKVVGSNTGLHPLLVLLAVFMAGKFGGLIAMVLAVPVVGILKLFFEKWVAWSDKKSAAKEAFAGLPPEEDLADGSEDKDKHKE